ncbi:IS66 family insertion sequence element accessory protein TnpB [Sphingobium sp. SA916]|uniref:IS66 family insertion sequence element accessory protein TnpB n=1 Tax=Sphingobium sp. SA916 TaxID=1851207 RepID=UPI001C0F3804|nr:IS66 family insertion sequence element accessory protein TnpB [Sphingobium sp. SA916]
MQQGTRTCGAACAAWPCRCSRVSDAIPSRAISTFRGRRGDLCKIIWHDGIGMSLYAKRLERGKYIWPSAVDGVIAISPSQMACMLEAIDWRNPQATWRPTLAG